MRVEDLLTILNYLYFEESHRLSSEQHDALGSVLLILRTLPPDSIDNINAVMTGLRFVQEPK